MKYHAAKLHFSNEITKCIPSYLLFHELKKKKNKKRQAPSDGSLPFFIFNFLILYSGFGSYKMKLNRELSTACWKLSQQSWQDDSVGCCWHIWYCPF